MKVGVNLYMQRNDCKLHPLDDVKETMLVWTWPSIFVYPWDSSVTLTFKNAMRILHHFWHFLRAFSLGSWVDCLVQHQLWNMVFLLSSPMLSPSPSMYESHLNSFSSLLRLSFWECLLSLSCFTQFRDEHRFSGPSASCLRCPPDFCHCFHGSIYLCLPFYFTYCRSNI